MWRYATPDEIEAMKKIPSVSETDVDLRDWQNEVYPVLSGRVLSREGEIVEVPPDMVLKILAARVEETWCYETLQVTVSLMGHPSPLKDGTWVALFQASALQSLKMSS